MSWGRCVFSIPLTDMNSSDYLRRKTKALSQTLGFQNGQDSSLQTMKVQARATKTTHPIAVAANHSQIDPHLQAYGVTNTPTDAAFNSAGYKTVVGKSQSGGFLISDMTANRILGAQSCAVCSDSPSSAPFNIVLPCVAALPDIKNAPGKTVCCADDMSQLYRDNGELVAQQGKQAALRTAYNLPNKLQGLRGPIVNNRR